MSLVAANGSSVTQSFTLTVYQAPVDHQRARDLGGPRSELDAFSRDGHRVPRACVLRAAGLPSGVSLVSGVIQGTPKASGTFPVTITAKSVAGTTSQSFTLLVANSVGLGLDQPTAIAEDQG